MKLRHMRVAALAALAALVTVLVAGSASAQKTVITGTGAGGTQHATSTWTINGATISIEYGRPTLKGRPESQLMPVRQPWRTGADVATIITTDKPLTFGSTTLAPGRYTINTEPGDKEWHLILGKLGSPDQWGVPYLPNLEIGRVPMKLDQAAQSVEQLTITIDPGQTPSLHVAWGRTAASVPFRVGS
ncbi:MAG TPA: DUF2911 domain-containing protein [Gemmatimonadaceae bacterium]|nr:DUF2911 domain-containing protein [Gemmatimonadaceae bacterium]